MRKSVSYGLSGYCGFTGRGVRTDAIIIIDFSNAFDLVPSDRLFTKIATTGVDLKVVVWVKEFLLGRTQRVRVDGQLTEEVRVTSGVPQGSLLCPLLFLAYVNDIRKTLSLVYCSWQKIV
jgi:hypothetical protein